MIINRKEFHLKKNIFTPMNIEKTIEEVMCVKMLFKEIKADAFYRNHNYMFKKDADFKNMVLQEVEVGIKNKFPEIKTEQERFDKIQQELKDDTYNSIPLLRDIDYPSVFYIEDGFHRIFLAHKLGYDSLRIISKYGKFNFNKSIAMKDISKLLEMVNDLTGGIHTLKSASELFKNIKEERKDVMIVYG